MSDDRGTVVAGLPTMLCTPAHPGGDVGVVLRERLP
jgi:hypothetical protein